MERINKEDLLKIKMQIEYVTNAYRKTYPIKISSEKKEKGLIITMKLMGLPCDSAVDVYISSDEFGDIYKAFGTDFYATYWEDVLMKLKNKLNNRLIKWGLYI